ncbi:hypothetical protein RTP6_005519 [Batrachochytrium dendrobatidis]
MLTAATNGGNTVHTKIQTESRQDVQFVRKELDTAISEAVQKRRQQFQTVSDARTRIIAAKKLRSTTGVTDKQPPRADVEGVQLEVERRLAQWINLTFEYAASNIEVNGMDFNKAFEEVQEYEPIDEALRQEADELHTSVQSALVRTTQMRREIPQQLELMISDSVQILTDITSKAAMVEPQAAGHEPIPEFGILDNEFDEVERDYSDISTTCNQVDKLVVLKLEKAERAQRTLDSLKVPPASEISTEALQKRQTPRGNHRKSFAAKHAVTPRTARFGLLKRLEAEASCNLHTLTDESENIKSELADTNS